MLLWFTVCAPIKLNFPFCKGKPLFGALLTVYQADVWSGRCIRCHVGWNSSKIITPNRRYHQRLCLEARHINSAHAPLNRDDGGLLPDAYLHLVRKKVR